ncbi:peptide-n4-(n-acetyl-beta-glucosaminyl)asparagine amidase a [Phlyctema vagabunda]|uniref:Peptide-n4-(N-acetyl-beta-glucosaminyl)asparagine amidase a n=1 Tax=Phlyctema vagabunda TaxID=108571 RepID=A0ABR4PG91_9HELO
MIAGLHEGEHDKVQQQRCAIQDQLYPQSHSLSSRDPNKSPGPYISHPGAGISTRWLPKPRPALSNPAKMLVLLLTAITAYLSFSRPSSVSALELTSAPAGLLEVFEVQAPLRSTYGETSCEQVIVQHEFAASYGTPYVGTYAPPEDCDFSTVIFNLSITSAGINYDRLGLLFFGDIEVWRMTTGMPVRTGIFYNYQKDVTAFHAILSSEQKVIMSMDNIYNDVFTGTFKVTITALYYNDAYKTFNPAQEIMPISSKSSANNQSSVVSLPDGNASIITTFPRNVERAIVSILASGNGAEEFWYTNVPTEYANTFNNTAVYGYSPFREVQLLIDGKLAGVSWPLPTVFTGGINTGLWVPIVSFYTYELPSFEIDISPWLGLLCDGSPHTFELKVVGYDTDTLFGTIGSNWWITGSIFIWTDKSGNQTTGSKLISSSPLPSFEFIPEITKAPNDTVNSTLWISLAGSRSLSHSSSITTSSGTRTLTWAQELSYSNIQNFTALGRNETLSQTTSGTSTFSSVDADSTAITNTFAYPITFFQGYIVSPDAAAVNSTLDATIDHSVLSSSMPLLAYLTTPASFAAPRVLETRQNGSCVYYWNNTYYEFAGAIDPAMGSLGATEQWYSFSSGAGSDGGKPVAYGRYVLAVDGYEPDVVEDRVYDTTIDVPDTVPLGR